MSNHARAKRPNLALIFGIVCVQGFVSLSLTSPGLPPWDRAALSTFLVPLGAVALVGGLLFGLWISFLQKEKIGIVLIASTLALNPYTVGYFRAVLVSSMPTKGVTGEITGENWKEHETILDIRRVYEQIQTDRKDGRLVEKTDELNCESNQVRIKETRTAGRDGSGVLRLYVTEQEDVHAGALFRKKKVERYYDSQGILRDAYLEFWHGRSQYGGIDTMQVVFFDRASDPVWSWLDEFGKDRPLRRYGKALIEPWMLSLGTADEMRQMFERHSFECVPIGPPIQDPRY